MDHSVRRFSIGKKMYMFLIFTVLLAVTGICVISYNVNAQQIDAYYKRLTINSAKNFASLVDADYVKQLRAVAESDEYQELRDLAEETDDESLIQEYLEEKGLWEGYVDQRNRMITYQENMVDIKYIYVVAWAMDQADDGEYYDMYILDADDVPLYETGYYELREEEFKGIGASQDFDPVISNGDWGWLCSGYAPVYDDYGKLVCTVGCDVGMEEVMAERQNNLTYIITGAVIYSIFVLIGAFFFVNRFVVKPLNALTSEMKKFSPKRNRNYEESCVINSYENRSHDEIEDIYNEIRSMQIRIIDYIDDITAIKQDKEKVEKEIGQISEEALRDSLTGVGNKKAYLKKQEALNKMIGSGSAEFAVIMLDVNGLKTINDNHGHIAGDTYIKGCCHVVCDILKHSPVYRIGGDEFAAILAGEDYEHRQERLDMIRDAFEKTFDDETLDPWLRYSAAAGMAEYTSDDNAVDEVFRRADHAMYEAKSRFKAEHGLDTGIR